MTRAGGPQQSTGVIGNRALLVCGSRSYSKFQTILRSVRAERERFDYLVEGGATGADAHAKHAALLLRLPYREHRVDWEKWEKWEKAAGPIRNLEMLEQNRNIVETWAFVSCVGTVDLLTHLRRSRGTYDMVRLAAKRGIVTRVYGESGVWQLAVWHGDDVILCDKETRLPRKI